MWLAKTLGEYARSGKRAGSFWTVLFGSIIPALSILNFVIALFTMETSALVGEILGYYEGFTALVFRPIELLFRVSIPQILRDILVFWTIAGIVGTRALAWASEELVLHAEARLPLAKAGSDDEEFLRTLIEKNRPPQNLKKVVAALHYLIGCLVGPAILVFVWAKSAQLPDTALTPRSIILLHLIALLGWFAFGLVTNWVAPA